MKSNKFNSSNSIEQIIENDLKINQGFCSLTGILRECQKQGIEYPKAWGGLKVYFEIPENQLKWTDWKLHIEREEIRLRLKLLQETSSLHESLVSFITFFFRASDPILYQLSAVIMGHWLNEFPELKSYFDTYCKLRNVHQNTPIKLNNTRTKRRILLVLCAAHLNNPKAELPFDIESNQSFSDSDLSILLLACSILTDAGNVTAYDIGQSLITKRYKSESTIQDKRLVRNTVRLLDASQKAKTNAVPLLNICLDGIIKQFEQADSFAAHLQVYFLLNELMEGFVKSNAAPNLEIIPKPIASFCAATLHYWLHQFNNDSVSLKIDDLSDDNTVSTQFIRRKPFSSARSHYQFFSEYLVAFSDSKTWYTKPVEERAAVAFFLIQYCFSTLSYNKTELTQLYKSCGLYLNSGQNNLFTPIFSQLLKKEPSLSETYCDPQLIHRLNDTALLASLIPTEQNSEILPIIADSVEYLIRFRIFTDPHFNPNNFLMLLSVRKPNILFFHHLAELSNGREYPTSSGENYSLYEAVKFFIQEYNQSEEKPERKAVYGDYFNALTAFRTGLKDSIQSDDPHNLIKTVIHHLRGTGAEQIRGQITLIDLAEIIQPRYNNWLHSGAPAISAKTGREFIQEAIEIADILENKAVKASPEHLSMELRVSESTQSIRFYLELIEKEFSPLLPKTEASLFSKLLKKCSLKLTNWESAYETALTVLQNNQDEKPIDTYKTLLDSLNSIENESIQSKILGIVLSTIQNQSESPDKDESWLKSYTFLEWTTGYKPNFHELAKNLWQSHLKQMWLKLAQDAMDRNAEARVVQLVRNTSFKKITEMPEVQEMLIQMRTWCISRYDIFHAYECNRHLSARFDIPVISVFLRTIRQYAGYYTRVWLALLIGVIFMFDFGDPWLELAEIGDAGGVIFAFSFGVAGTFLYVWYDLKKKTVYLKGDAFTFVSNVSRVSIFLITALIYTALVVILFWYMFSSTDQVVHGPNAILHIISWTGFALFIGVFLGLLGRSATPS